MTNLVDKVLLLVLAIANIVGGLSSVARLVVVIEGGAEVRLLQSCYFLVQRGDGLVVMII